MSNLLVSPIEDNAAKVTAERKTKPTKSGWLDDLITEKARKALQLPPTKTTTTTKPGFKSAAKNAMVKILEDEEDREAKVDYRKRIGNRHEQVDATPALVWTHGDGSIGGGSRERDWRRLERWQRGLRS